jgi:hypothetical protein
VAAFSLEISMRKPKDNMSSPLFTGPEDRKSLSGGRGRAKTAHSTVKISITGGSGRRKGTKRHVAKHGGSGRKGMIR